jgi:hypothetical protein
MLKQVDEKWATDARWKRAEVSKAANASSTMSRWRFTDEKGQAWDGIVSVQPSEKNHLLLTLRVVRSDSNASAQLK